MCSVKIKDDDFKFVLEVFAFEESTNYASNWLEQIHKLDSYWDKMIDNFDILEFKSFFRRYCQRVYNCSGDDYNIQESFEKAKSVWRLQLMMNIADEIAHTFIPSAPLKSNLVKWTGSMMIVKVCKIFLLIQRESHQKEDDFINQSESRK